MIKTILFDLDGVLVDACDWHYDALNEALRVHGYTSIDRCDHESKFNGLPTKTKLDMLGIPKELHDSINRRKQKETLKKFLDIQFDQTKQDLFKALKAKYKLGCVSNAQKQTVATALGNMRVYHLFDVVYGNQDFINPKPNSEGYVKAMVHLQSKPHETIIVEDSDKGVFAAQQVGAKVIRVANATEVTFELFQREGLL